MAEIVGHVDGRHRAIVALSLPGQDDDLLTLVDTGFNGELLIQDSETRRFNCEIKSYDEPVEFADGERRLLKRGRTKIIWFGRLREIEILIAPSKRGRGPLPDQPVCLLGTALLSPHNLTIDFTARRVVISESEA